MDIVNLFDVPLGTALGVYSLWVTLNIRNDGVKNLAVLSPSNDKSLIVRKRFKTRCVSCRASMIEFPKSFAIVTYCKDIFLRSLSTGLVDYQYSASAIYCYFRAVLVADCGTVNQHAMWVICLGKTVGKIR